MEKSSAPAFMIPGIRKKEFASPSMRSEPPDRVPSFSMETPLPTSSPVKALPTWFCTVVPGSWSKFQ